MQMFSFFQKFVETQDGKVLFVLALVAGAMIIDFISGTWAAKMNKNIKFESDKGINGILRKIASLTLMIFFIPFSVIIPYNAGIGLIYVLYLGYLFMELKSILENFAKMGIEVTLFKKFLDSAENKTKEEE